MQRARHKNSNYYGNTRWKVKAFQKAKGLNVEGKAGPQTRTTLGGFYMSDQGKTPSEA